MKTKAFRAALPYTLPICVGFLFLGMSYGFLMRSQGFSFVYPMLMSLFIFAGSMEFVTANLLLMPTFQPLHAFLLTLMVNARHLFYGLSMLDKFQNLGWKKPYLIFGMCMEEEYPAFHRWWNHPLYGTGAAGILMLQFISNECPDGSDRL